MIAAVLPSLLMLWRYTSGTGLTVFTYLVDLTVVTVAIPYLFSACAQLTFLVSGDRVKATIWADRAGQVFGWICVVGGLYAFFLTRDLSWVWTSLIGWFIAGSATAEAQQAVLASRLRGIRASQVMTPDPVTVPGSMTVSEFIGDYLFRARHQSFPVTGNGGDTVTDLAGIITPSDISRMIDNLGLHRPP